LLARLDSPRSLCSRVGKRLSLTTVRKWEVRSRMSPSSSLPGCSDSSGLSSIFSAASETSGLFRWPVLTDVRIIEPERYADGRSRSERRFWSTQGVSSLTVYRGLPILSSCIDSRSGPYIVKPGREKPSLAHLPSDNPGPSACCWGGTRERGFRRDPCEVLAAFRSASGR
jgi:hypothetical protein